jgi:hypothetical protein
VEPDAFDSARLINCCPKIAGFNNEIIDIPS